MTTLGGAKGTEDAREPDVARTDTIRLIQLLSRASRHDLNRIAWSGPGHFTPYVAPPFASYVAQ